MQGEISKQQQWHRCSELALNRAAVVLWAGQWQTDLKMSRQRTQLRYCLSRTHFVDCCACASECLNSTKSNLVSESKRSRSSLIGYVLASLSCKCIWSPDPIRVPELTVVQIVNIFTAARPRLYSRRSEGSQCSSKGSRGAADVFVQMLLSQVCVWLRGTDRSDGCCLLFGPALSAATHRG